MKMYWSTRRHRTKLLSLLCALAIFASLIPSVSAAVSSNVLENNTITDTVTPAGIQINLFDYWVAGRDVSDSGTDYKTSNGINQGHDLRFMANGDGGNNGTRINKYTGKNGGVRSGIVQDRLSGGYPVLKSGNYTGLEENNGLSRAQSLDYLFDKSEEINKNGSKSGTLGKKTFWDVDGLLQVDDDGYYYFNADNNKAGEGKSYETANYACFDEKANAFTVYNTWGVQKAGNGDQEGQFFPFNSPSSLDIFTENNNGQLVPNTGINSRNPAINHFFGVSMTTRFVQRYNGKTTEDGDEAMTFQFAGDDDVWIFIDGVLVADLGGIHDQATTTIDFVSGDIIVNTKKVGTLKSIMSENGYKDDSYWNGDTFANDTYHTLKLFYLERGGTDSNLAMKFNLAYVPETDGIKVDQNGTLLPGVQFDLYAANRTGNGDGPYTYTKVDPDPSTPAIEPIGSGTTDENGRFVLTNADDIAVSLNDLNKRKIQYLILEEQNENRTGYRHDDSIYLVLQSNDVESVLLNDENHRWTTGTYAALKGSVSTGPDITLSDTGRKINLDTDGGKLFAVIMRRLENVGINAPSATDAWGVVTGSALSGWQVTGRESGSYIPAVIKALQGNAAANGNAVVFAPAANGSYMAELKNCPGDLRNYYYWSKDADTAHTAYTVAFYYTTASDLSRATEKNTYWVDGKDFERQFAATIYIPNVKHYLNVQKLDDNNDPVNGVTFALYEKDDLTVDEKTGTYTIREVAKPYDTVITGTDGKAKFPSEGQVLAEGQYYLVEDSAPVGYKVNATAVPVIVDDTHGVMADAGTANDGVAVTVAEGHLVPTMTPFATNDAIDHSLTDITTTRMEAESGWDPALAKTGQTVNLTLDTENFKKDHPVQTLRYIPVNTENESLSWRTETGWLWFHIEQTPIADSDPDKNLKTDLGGRDLTRLFTGETTVIVTNQRVGTLAVTKNVVVDDTSSDRPDPDAAYHVTITLSQDGKPINDAVACEDSAHELQSVLFDKGKAVLSLKADQTITFPDLPAGTAWTVEETETLSSDNWETTVTSTGGTVTNKVASGEIKDTNQNDTVNITNTYYAATPTKAEATIKVSKEYAKGEGKTAYTGDVSFTLTRDPSNSADDPLANSSPMTISITGKASKSFETLEFTKAGTYTYTVSEVNGGVNGMTYAETVYTVTFNVARGTGSDRNKLVATPTYTVVEKPGDASNSYPYTDTTGLLFTNTYNPGSSEEQDKGSLSITKTVNIVDNSTETPNLDTDTYPIVVTLTNGSSPITGAVTCTDPLDSTHTSVTFGSDGEATLSLKHSQTITLTGLPVGTTWTVCEGTLTNAERWDTKYKVNNVDVASASGTISTTGSAVNITNTYDPNGGEIVPGGTGALSISKEIGEGIDPDTTFDFLIEVAGASGRYDAASTNGFDDYVTFTDGKTTVQLKGGDTLVIKGLPAGASYTVTEQNADKYNVTYDPAAPDKIVKDETVTCRVTNELKNSKPDTGSLTIRKTVGEGIDTSLDFQFSVTLTYPNQPTETLAITVKANGSVIIPNLPVGTDYDVTETTTGYTVTATNATGSIPVGGTTAAFHNALTGGGDVPGPGPGPNPGGDDGGTPALNRRDHYAYIIGYPDGNVRPQGNITRAEVATIFFRLLRDPVRTQYWSQTNSYSDVAGDKWYNNAISTLTNMGIICGYPDGTFRPDAPITRAELTKIAAGFFSDPRVAATYDGRFSDVHGAEWYISYLMTAIKEGLIEGYPDGSFRPDRPITRAETCTIVNRTLGRKPDKDHLLPESVMINWPDNLDRNVWYYAQMQEATNSHDYRWTSVYSEVCEQWTAKLIERDWAALERTWSHAHSAPGGEVMQ